MKYRNMVLASAAAFGLGLAAESQAAHVQLGFILQTADGSAELPQNAGIYQVNPGEEFKVVVTAVVIDPNLTDNNRNAANNGQPLGFQAATFDILTPGTSGVVVPKADPGDPPTWADYEDRTNDGYAYPLTNLLDFGSDGDLDAVGAGMANTVTNSLATNANAGARARVQYGVGDPIEIIAGNYVAGAGGLATLTTDLRSIIIYADDPENTTGLLGIDVTSISIPATAQIEVVPEPASAALLGLGAFGLLGARRRRA